VREQVRALGEALAAGPAAALAGSAAASIIAGAARAADDGTHAAQATALGERLTRAAGADAEALAAARAGLAAPPAGDERGDFALGRALERAAAVPLLIAEACADLVALARVLEPLVAADHAPDVHAAAMLAAGAAHAAAHLVEVNLGVGPDDARLARARAAVAAADLALVSTQ
jgi:formiminotetrahydrofolate cyclodeaminase